MAGSVRAPPTHPMDCEAGAVAGAREVGGGERWRSVGDEDRHAAFFLTIADEKNKPEFCKSDPRRRRGGGGVGDQPVHSRPAALHRAFAALWQIPSGRARPIKSLAFEAEPSDKPVRRSLLLLSCLPFAPSLSTASPSTFLAHGGEG